MRYRQISPFNDYNIEPTLLELVQMYMDEGKSGEEALKLAIPVCKFMHADNRKQAYSWFKSHWERNRSKKIDE